MKKIKFWIGMVVFGLFLTCSSNSVYSANLESKGNRKTLKELVRVANGVCPFRAGDTRFDKVELLPKDEVGIFITYMKETPVSKYSDSQLESLDKEPVRQQLISVVTSDAWSALRAGEATFVISYSDRRGRELFRVKIYPEDYLTNGKSNKGNRQTLAELVRVANEICPFRAGDTRFDKVELLPKDEVGIFITYMKDTPVSKYSDSQLESLDKEPVRQQLISVVKSDAWSTLRAGEATFVISYSDRRGRELFRVKIYPEDYLTNGKSNKGNRQTLAELVRVANEICPFRAGDTRFDKVELLPKDEVGIFITYMKDTPVSKYSDSQLESLDKEPVRQQLISVVKSDAWSTLRAGEATFVISYSDRRGRELFRVKIYPEDYL